MGLPFAACTGCTPFGDLPDRTRRPRCGNQTWPPIRPPGVLSLGLCNPRQPLSRCGK